MQILVSSSEFLYIFYILIFSMDCLLCHCSALRRTLTGYGTPQSPGKICLIPNTE